MRSIGHNVPDMLLTAAIMLAGIDYTGILDYVLKAILGGAIWFGIKVYAERKIQAHKKATNKRTSIKPKKQQP